MKHLRNIDPDHIRYTIAGFLMSTLFIGTLAISTVLIVAVYKP